MTATTDWRVWQDSAVATNFVTKRRSEFLEGGVPLEVMLGLLRAAGLNAQSEGQILDIGCGGGALLEVALDAFPRLTGIALDGSLTMLDAARKNLARFDSVAFVEADFNDPLWRDALPAEKFAAVISGYAIHHSEDDRKRTLYAEIYDLLAPGGVFVNVEHVASVSPFGETLYETACVEHVVRLRREKGEVVDFNAVWQEFASRPDKAANRLTPVETQLNWLRNIGFSEVDCYWKYFELAVLAGYKR